MNMLHNDINDNEIRIISSGGDNNNRKRPSRRKRFSRRTKIFSLLIFILAVAVSLILILPGSGGSDPADELEITTEQPAERMPPADDAFEAPVVDEPRPMPFVEVTDTVINREKLTILTPVNAVPHLEIGPAALSDTAAVLVVEAADIRKDTGGIVGAYVMDGNLLSRGQSKTGFCAIINGVITVGVADSTPYLEQAIESDGYFFRQYPLVVGGLVVENKLKYSSLRKALATLDGNVVVILSHSKMTLNEFAATLSNLGVTNAISLVGSSSYGFGRDYRGNKIEFGSLYHRYPENVNYIVWQ